MKKVSIQRSERSTVPFVSEFEIRYSKQAEKFFEKNQRFSREETRGLILQSVKHLMKIEASNLDIKPLHGELAGSYRLRKGNIRIIFSYEHDEIVIAHVETIDFRGNVY